MGAWGCREEKGQQVAHTRQAKEMAGATDDGCSVGPRLVCEACRLMLKSGEQQGLPLSCTMVPAIDEKGCGIEETFSVLNRDTCALHSENGYGDSSRGSGFPRRGQLSLVIALFA